MKVLFVCEGNVNRSQMAAAYLKSVRPDIEVASAGTLVPRSREGKSINSLGEEAVALMQKIGIDMSGAVSHQLTKEMLADADKVILMGPTPGGPLPHFLERSEKLVRWSIPDPGYGQIEVEDARERVVRQVQEMVKDLDGGSGK